MIHFIVVVLFIFGGFNVLRLLFLPMVRGKVVVTEMTDAQMVSAYFGSTVRALVYIIAAIIILSLL